MKGDTEWDSVTAKVSGKEPNYKDMRVTCYIATINDDASSPVVQQVGSMQQLLTGATVQCTC